MAVAHSYCYELLFVWEVLLVMTYTVNLPRATVMINLWKSYLYTIRWWKLHSRDSGKQKSTFNLTKYHAATSFVSHAWTQLMDTKKVTHRWLLTPHQLKGRIYQVLQRETCSLGKWTLYHQPLRWPPGVIMETRSVTWQTLPLPQGIHVGTSSSLGTYPTMHLPRTL